MITQQYTLLLKCDRFYSGLRHLSDMSEVSNCWPKLHILRVGWPPGLEFLRPEVKTAGAGISPGKSWFQYCCNPLVAWGNEFSQSCYGWQGWLSSRL